MGTERASASLSAAANYTWFTTSGAPVPTGKGLLVAWDANSQTEQWSVVIDQPNIVGGISCVEDRVLATCASGYGMCNYDARTGTVSQTVTDESEPLFVHANGAESTLTTKSVICDPPECFAWNDDNVLRKLHMA